MSRLLVLGWHNLAATPSYPDPAGAGATGFARQVAWLRRLMTPVPLDAALRALAAGRRLPRRAVALTFDDGYRDNLTIAAPVLRSMAVPATFFLVPGFLDGRVTPWWEALAVAWRSLPDGPAAVAGWRVPAAGPERTRALHRAQEELKAVDGAERDSRVARAVADAAPGIHPAVPAGLMMDWDDAARLVAMGFAVGSHSDTHPILARESPERQRTEVADARAALRERLGVPVPLLAYPNGSAADLDAVTLAAARDAGHEFALSTIWGLNDHRTDRYAVRRVLVQPTRTLKTLRWDLGARPWRTPAGAGGG